MIRLKKVTDSRTVSFKSYRRSKLQNTGNHAIFIMMNERHQPDLSSSFHQNIKGYYHIIPMTANLDSYLSILIEKTHQIQSRLNFQKFVVYPKIEINFFSAELTEIENTCRFDEFSQWRSIDMDPNLPLLLSYDNILQAFHKKKLIDQVDVFDSP